MGDGKRPPISEVSQPEFMKLCLRCNQYFEDTVNVCPIEQSPLEPVGDHPLIGALINDRYVVDSVIGKGSTGIVYKATRLLMGSEVAVKVLHSYLGAESGALDRFLREARAASRLRHPHIINIWEFGATDDGQPYFVMDYLEGMTLADLIKQKGFLHISRAIPIVRQICDALAEAHRQSIIHRDIKPENIVLQEAHENDYVQGQDFVKVLDFGIADQPAGEKGAGKRAKMAAGSPAYMSPEQCQGFELDHRSDIYSLGIVVYEMLTGVRPFAADDVMSLFRQHVSQPPKPMSSTRPDLDLKFTPQMEAVITKALAKKPANRQQSIKEFQREIEEAAKLVDASPRPVESLPLDMWSVPVGEMLTDGSPSTGPGATTRVVGNFLPGPEDWMDAEDPHVADKAAVGASVGGNNSGKSAVVPSDAELQAKVNRLLKSARKASSATDTRVPAIVEPLHQISDAPPPPPPPPPPAVVPAAQTASAPPRPPASKAPGPVPPAAGAPQSRAGQPPVGGRPSAPAQPPRPGQPPAAVPPRPQAQPQQPDRPQPAGGGVGSDALRRPLNPSSSGDEQSFNAGTSGNNRTTSGGAPAKPNDVPDVTTWAQKVLRRDTDAESPKTSAPEPPAPPSVSPPSAPQASPGSLTAPEPPSAAAATPPPTSPTSPTSPAPSAPKAPPKAPPKLPTPVSPSIRSAASTGSGPGARSTNDFLKSARDRLTTQGDAMKAPPKVPSPSVDNELPKEPKPPAPPKEESPIPGIQPYQDDEPASPTARPSDSQPRISAVTSKSSLQKIPAQTPPAEPPKPVAPAPPSAPAEPLPPAIEKFPTLPRSLGPTTPPVPPAFSAMTNPTAPATAEEQMETGRLSLKDFETALKTKPTPEKPQPKPLPPPAPSPSSSVPPAPVPNVPASMPNLPPPTPNVSASTPNVPVPTPNAPAPTPNVPPLMPSVPAPISDSEARKPSPADAEDSQHVSSNESAAVSKKSGGIMKAAERLLGSFRSGEKGKDESAPPATAQPPASGKPAVAPSEAEAKSAFEDEVQRLIKKSSEAPQPVPPTESKVSDDSPQPPSSPSPPSPARFPQSSSLQNIKAAQSALGDRFTGPGSKSAAGGGRPNLQSLRNRAGSEAPPPADEESSPGEPSDIAKAAADTEVASDNAPAAQPPSQSPTGTISNEHLHDPDFIKRFNEPVNKAGAEALNPFANAVESLLDAAILPQRPSDKDPLFRATRSTESKPFTASTESKPFTTSNESKPLTASTESKPFTASSESKPFTAAGESKSFTRSAESKPFTTSGESKSLADSAAGNSPKPPGDIETAVPGEQKDEPPTTARPAFDAKRFEEPVNKGSYESPRKTNSGLDPKRFEEAVDKVLEPMKKTVPGKPNFDPKRFEEPINKGTLEPPGGKIISALETGRIDVNVGDLDPKKFEQPSRPGPRRFGESRSGINPFADKLPEPPAVPQPKETEAEQPAAPPPEIPTISRADELPQRPAGTIGGEAPAAKPAEPAEEDKTNDAVSRLLQAAQRAPEPSTASAKPEALNRKIEAVKKKIEALKAGGNPAADAPAPGQPAAPRALPTDPGALSDAVNRLLEAAQKSEPSGIYPSVPRDPNAPSPIPTAAEIIRRSEIALPLVSKGDNPEVPGTASSGEVPQTTRSTGSWPAETITRAAELVSQAIKFQRTQPESQDYYSGYKQPGKDATVDRAHKAEQRRKDRKHMRTSFQRGDVFRKRLLQLLVLILTGVAIWAVLGNGKQQISAFFQPPKSTTMTLEEALKKDKLDVAKTLIQQKLKGKLTPSEQEKVSEQVNELANKFATKGKYKEAVAMLGKLPKRSSSANRQLRRWTRLAEKEKSSEPSE